MIIETRNLTKTYNDRGGCREVSLAVRPGQIFGLLGPNGAGKSTFVKMIVGLIHPSEGQASVLGYPPGHVEARRKIGYLPELFRYPEWLSAEEVLHYHSRLSGMGVREARSCQWKERIRSVLEEVGLDGKAGERVRHFSKGMQQRLGLANALLLDPELVILDEPSSALDPIGRHEVRSILIDLRNRGKTVFLNTHLLEDVEALCDEVAFLYDGKLQAAGPLDKLLPESGVWEFRLGGWLPGTHDLIGLEPLPGVHLEISRLEADGTALLQAHLENREQAGWLTRRFVEEGLTLYEARPANGNLETWFLTMVEGKGGQRK